MYHDKILQNFLQKILLCDLQGLFQPQKSPKVSLILKSHSIRIPQEVIGVPEGVIGPLSWAHKGPLALHWNMMEGGYK